MVQPGDNIGSYVIDALLAEGGMGAVYRARNRVTGQLRAIKVIKPDLAQRPDFVERFVREATIASQVRHQYLVQTLEPGIDGNTIYLPMELLEGETLHARLRRDKRLSPQETASILGPVAEGMQALHDKRLVHRDLKPMNIFLTRGPAGDLIPKVLDFGTARQEQDDEHTVTGMVVGSPFYMAPEQAEGRRDIDARVDQYALGVMAYQMVTGQRPYESDDTRSALAKLLRGDPYELPRQLFSGMPDVFEQVIVRMLAREREQRFRTIVDAGHALSVAASAPMPPPGHYSSPPPSLHAAPTAIRTSIPPSVPPPRPEAAGVAAHFTPAPSPTSMPAPARRSAAPWVLGAGALVLLGAIAAVVAWQLTQPPEVTTTELAPRARPETAAPSITTPSSISAPSIAPPISVPATPATDPVGAAGDVAPEVSEDEARSGTSVTSTPVREGRPREPRESDPPSDREVADEPCGAASGIPCLD